MLHLELLMGVGAIVMWGFLILSGRAGAALTLSGTQWIWVLLTSVLLSGYVWTWYRALQTAPATVVTSVTTIGAVLTVGLSIVLEGKPTTGLQVAGSALLISGCLLFLWRQLRALPRAEAAA
ncbi:EamA family transporter [Candidatus Amarolinea dominans]|uniref:EamA family transporter n=1 Tax=Candidatus Amarolinea dominans TaxID=3140696 RepID=UPI00313545D2|nr:EamA family transporter [Anaerolineae bacterium]